MDRQPRSWHPPLLGVACDAVRTPVKYCFLEVPELGHAAARVVQRWNLQPTCPLPPDKKEMPLTNCVSPWLSPPPSLQFPITLPLPLPAPFNVGEVRYGLTLPPTIASGPGGPYVGLQLQGDVVPLGFTGTPPIPAAALPAFDGSQSQYYLEVQLSTYTLLSAVWTFQSKSACISAFFHFACLSFLLLP